jgi:hypothetical protein
MAEYTVTNLALQVETFRNAQNLHEVLWDKYANSLKKDDHHEAIRVLEIARNLEKSLDDTIRDILHGQAFDSRVMIDIETYQAIIDRENDALAENARLKKITAGLFEVLDNVVKAYPEGSGNTGLPPLKEMIASLKKTAGV